MTEFTKNPLNVYVCWHPEFEDGSKYAEEIFNALSRRKDDYVGESIGIPVYFINNPQFDLVSKFGNAKYNAIVLLVDNKMVLNEDWRAFIDILCAAAETHAYTKIYPVATNAGKGAYTLCSRLNRKNYIRLVEGRLEKNQNRTLDDKSRYLLFELVHELSRALFNRPCSREIESDGTSASLKIFISYARQDGFDYVQIFNDYISKNTSLDRFIDVYSISGGEDFQNTIDKNLDSSALMIICTDIYSSRQWCQHEALYAKYRGCPIILVDAIDKGEARRFPYLANIKTVHLGHEKNISDSAKQDIIYTLLWETLKIKYNKEYLWYMEQLHKVDEESTAIFPYPPELYTLLFNDLQKEQVKTILYSEPPLNINEIRILKKLKSTYEFITPTYILGKADRIANADISGTKIGISISELSDEEDTVKTNTHLSQLYIELCRYLLARNVKIVYGGNINYSSKYNFVEILKHLISAYYSNNRIDDVAIQYFNLQDLYPIDENQEVDLRVHKISVHKVCLKKYSSESEQNFRERSYTHLRQILNENCDARIVLGGKTRNFAGKMPGLVEEAYLAMNKGLPLFVVGGYGGASGLIVECLDGEIPDIVDSDVSAFFAQNGYRGLNNGLTEEENRKLCHSDNISEIIALILSGLSRLRGPKDED